jgi:Fur family ferric uptake transcriptional regulator
LGRRTWDRPPSACGRAPGSACLTADVPLHRRLTVGKSDDYRERLRKAGLRATAPRLSVLRYVTEAATPLSHGEVAEGLTRHGIDRATAYRNLIDLTDAGLLHRADFGDHTWRFTVPNRRHTPPEMDHPHFICSSCGAVECLPKDAVAVKPFRHAPSALRQHDLQIQVRGLCDDCR